MSKINISADLLAKLKHFSDQGEVVPSAVFAMLENEFVMSLTAAAKVGNVINVSGKLTKLDGRAIAVATNVICDSIPVAGAGTLAVHAGGGTSKAGAASTKLWFQTNADGTFSIDVTDATGGDPCLLRFTTDNGMSEVIQLGF